MPRDVNGVYTLPAGNPVVPGTVISTNWANTTLTDIAAALTASITQTAADARYLKLTGGTLTGGLTVPSLNGGQLAGMRNKIINGDMRFAQRGTSSTPAVDVETYLVDRWTTYTLGAPLAISQGTGTGAFKYALAAVGAAGNTTLAFGTKIESLGVYDLSGKQVTLSAYVFSTNSVTGAWYIYSANSIDNFGAKTLRHSGTLPLSAGWNYVSATIPAFDGTASSNGAQITFEMPATLAGITRAITGVQLEVGPVATPFEHRPYGVELALCQRYYQTELIEFCGYVVSGATYYVRYPFKTRMRTVPTMVLSGGYGNGFPSTNGTALAGEDSFSESRVANANANAGSFASNYSASAEL